MSCSTRLCKANEWLRNYKKLIGYYESTALSWKEKYDLIFSPELAHLLSAHELWSDYYDPDSSYQEDVTAFVLAARDILPKIEEIIRVEGS